MTDSKTKRMRRRKEYLYRENPYCALCGVKMYLNKRGERSAKSDLATIDHIHNKYHLKERHKKQTKAERILGFTMRLGRTRLLCKKCNTRIANEETKRLPIEELWKRSGAYPSGIMGGVKRFIRHAKSIL